MYCSTSKELNNRNWSFFSINIVAFEGLIEKATNVQTKTIDLSKFEKYHFLRVRSQLFKSIKLKHFSHLLGNSSNFLYFVDSCNTFTCRSLKLKSETDLICLLSAKEIFLNVTSISTIFVPVILVIVLIIENSEIYFYSKGI